MMKLMLVVIFHGLLSPLAYGDRTTDKINDYLQRKYYRIEFILFERNPGRNQVTGEQLGVDHMAPWPLNMMTMPADDAALARAYALDRFARTQLEWPIVEFQTNAKGAPTNNTRLPDESNLTPDSSPNSDVSLVPDIQPEIESPRDLFQKTIEAYEQQLLENSFRMFTQLNLNSHARKISRRHDILFHGAWQQPIPERSDPMPFLFQLSHDLEGFFGVTLGRYLHFQIDLYQRLNPPQHSIPQPISTPINPEQPLLVQTPTVQSPVVQTPPQSRFLHFKESRRMRSDELHYLDHPRFGIVVKIDPIVPPEDVILEYQALERKDR